MLDEHDAIGKGWSNWPERLGKARNANADGFLIKKWKGEELIKKQRVFDEKWAALIHACEVAIANEADGQGGYYTGPYTAIYLRVRGMLQTFRVKMKEQLDIRDD